MTIVVVVVAAKAIVGRDARRTDAKTGARQIRSARNEASIVERRVRRFTRI